MECYKDINLYLDQLYTEVIDKIALCVDDKDRFYLLIDLENIKLGKKLYNIKCNCTKCKLK